MRRATWGWVAVFAVGVCLGWLPFIGRSLSPDEGGFLIVGSQWTDGSSLYGDYWVDRPPVLIWIFEAADALGGVVPLRLMGTAAVVLAVLLAAVLGRQAAPGEHRGVLMPAAAAAFLAASPLLGGSVVNAEVLGLPLVLAGMVALVKAHTHAGTPAWGWAAAAGALGMLAFEVKQSLLDVFVMAAALLLTRSRSVRAVAGIAVGAVLTGAVTLALAASRGTSPSDLWEAVVTFRVDAARVLVDSSQASAGGRLTELMLSLLFS